MIRQICDFPWSPNDVLHDRVYCASTTMPAERVNGRSSVLPQDGRLRSTTNTVGISTLLTSYRLSELHS